MLARIGLAIVLIVAQGLCVATERVQREEITNQVRMAYFKRDYAAIEALLEQAKQQPVTVGGTYKSALVISYLDQFLPPPVNQPYSEQFWTVTQSRIDEWGRAFPKSSMAAYAASQLPLWRAFNVRRHRPTDTMTAADWEAFDASAQKAADFLRDAQGRVEQDGVWQVAMLKVARYQRMETAAYQRLVQDAAARFPDYRPLYAAAVPRLRPQGGGSTEALDWLAQLALNNAKSQSGVAAYAAVYIEASRFSEPAGLFESTLLDWKRMKAGMEDTAKQYPDTYNLSMYASFACTARDQETLKTLLDRLGTHIDRTIWADGERLGVCIGFSIAPTSGTASEHLYTWQYFQALIRNDDWKRIEDIYQQLLKSGTRGTTGLSLAHAFADFTAPRCVPVREERDTQQTAQANSDACRQRFDARLAAWQAAYPKSALPAIGKSESALVAAEALPATQLKARDEALDRAQAALDAVEVENRHVGWYLQAMRVATRQGWGQSRFMKLLKDGTARYPTHQELYRRGVLHFLPANGGTPAELDAVARLPMSLNDPATGLMLYANTYEEVIFGGGGYWSSAYGRTLVAWPEMRAGLIEFNRRYPGPWNHNRLAHHACVAGDNETLRELLARSDNFERDFRDYGWDTQELARCRARVQQRNINEQPATGKTSAVNPYLVKAERTS